VERLMCGLCGIVRFNRPPERDTASRMAELLGHRGPDGCGSFEDSRGVAFGHRRLAIIDLSDAGIQPFASDDGALQLLHNGEIYNYRELRVELERLGHRFRSATDTEVVLEAYREWGDECVKHFNGMWAIALWDGVRERLFCSRDRFGVKPFYYRYESGRFVFASELKAFRADPGGRLEPNLHAIRDYVEQGYVDHLPGTFFAGIEKIEPAHSLVLDRHGLRTTRYWALEPTDPPADPAEAVRELLLDSIRLRLRSDVAIGTALSGGLDSSAIACGIDSLLRSGRESAEHVGKHQRTFTVYFGDRGFDERPYAEAVVKSIGAEPRWISFTENELIDALPLVVEAQDEPFGSTSVVAQWFVMRAARDAGVKVMLDGQGGDESLLGYPTTFGYRFADLLAHAKLGELAKEVGAYRRLHGAGLGSAAVALATPFLPATARWRLRARRDGAQRLVHESLRARPPTPERTRSPFGERLRRQYHLILAERGLPELLRYEDRNSMTHSVEARVPFLDYRFVELLYSVSARDLLNGGMTKMILRRAAGDLLPSAVRDRVDKLGFVTPETRFFRGALGEHAAAIFDSRVFAQRGFIDAPEARRRLEQVRAGASSSGGPIWRAVNLELWARAFID
jgi:asparagine synthase (glutamine-hydrolysing)